MDKYGCTYDVCACFIFDEDSNILYYDAISFYDESSRFSYINGKFGQHVKMQIQVEHYPCYTTDENT